MVLVNWLKPTCFKPAKNPDLFQFCSRDHFNFVDNVFSSQKFIQVEYSQGFSPPHPTSLCPRQRAGSGEEGCGDVSHWWSLGGAWSSAQPPSQPGLLGWEGAEPVSGLGWGYNEPAAKSAQGSRRRLCLEMNAKELPVPQPAPPLLAVAQPGLAGLHTQGPALLP